MEDEVDAEILEPFELNFSDLVILSSSTTVSSSLISKEENERLETITRTIMETLGPTGPGLLTINGVPKASELRQTLLPLAKKLALLNNEDRTSILKEHGLGSDVSLKNLDRSVSSFSLQLKYAQSQSSDKGGDSLEGQLDDLNADSFHEFMDDEFRNLGKTFKELGVCMMELGLQLARICDRHFGGKEIEQSILDSSMAKGRLIHYHSCLENIILKGAEKRKGSRKKLVSHPLSCHNGAGKSEVSNRVVAMPHEGLNMETRPIEGNPCPTSLSNLWQQWHYDYGLFTVLTAPMFISSCHQPTTEAQGDGFWKLPEQEHLPSGHTYLQIFDPNKNKVFVVRSHPDNFLIQVGESADIISRGKLHSTLHSVSKPVNIKNLSRETFVVFLQPAWDKTFSTSHYHKESSTLNSSSTLHHPEQETSKIYQKIPPLSSRLKDGMSFAEFSRETTKQYYGSSGIQSNG
ncbi:2-oxoglutarate (2OG) and Fe(II)-dependent oxygenase superfamily protein [Thalictrum thalictroides]|uniref:2-oxoglutarate (2OG) and Fe(II)-dependent oxygenase superfamily protein n=1 Tax=Thalictrum thalictroides TaxID=46969 RepID=A0A7J6XH49_THATH|nr:2-oxoglutarate (2OG) and Fe(II)-dependent oxygenase superfamily protein [Thalictrum thalictroides]